MDGGRLPQNKGPDGEGNGGPAGDREDGFEQPNPDNEPPQNSSNSNRPTDMGQREAAVRVTIKTMPSDVQPAAE